MLRMGLLAGAACCLAIGACSGGGGGALSDGGAEGFGVVSAQQLPGGVKYAVYVPPGDAPSEGWPCIVFLNGRGECGTDGTRQLTVGLMPAVRAEPKRWPFVIVFPQKPDQRSLWGAHKEMVMAALEQTRSQHPINARRMYLTGLSQGGEGTFAIAASSPGVFAASAPVCGWGDPAVLGGSLRGGLWAFHGAADGVIPAEATRAVVTAVAGARGRSPQILEKDDGMTSVVRLTIYPGVGHNSWDKAYQESGVWNWFLRFRQ